MFAQRKGLPLTTQKDVTGAMWTATVTVGEFRASARWMPGTGVSWKHLRHLACAAFVEQHQQAMESAATTAATTDAAQQDYTAYALACIVPTLTIKEVDALPEPLPNMVAVDTEGRNPPRLAQLCVDGNTVYLLDLQKTTVLASFQRLMADVQVMKIVCDLAAEASALPGIIVRNAWDIQALALKLKLKLKLKLGKGDRPSLVSIVGALFGVALNKDKYIHAGGWRARPLTPEQRAYAAADAYLTYVCYQELSIPGSVNLSL